MSNIFPIDFEEKLTMAQDDYILFSDSEDGNKIKKAQYKNLKGEPGTPGTPGQDGAAATITVGSTTTGTPGSSASVTNSGTSSAAVLDFTIPQGAKGEPGEDGQDGAAATITVGTTTTLPAGSSATVTNSGTSSAAVLNFGIPQGEQGTGTGDVVGPASSTDGHLAVFDGATGKLIKDGGAIPTGDVGVSTDTGTLLSAGVDLWLGTETDFSSISTPDTNTLYIQYKSDGGGGLNIDDSFAGTALDTSIWTSEQLGNEGSLTVNNGLTLSCGSSFATSPNDRLKQGWRIYTNATFTGNESKIIAEVTYTGISGSGNNKGSYSIAGHECGQGASYIDSIVGMQYTAWNSTGCRLVTLNAAGDHVNHIATNTTFSNPFTVKIILDITNNKAELYINGTLKATQNSVLSSVKTWGDYIGHPLLTISPLYSEGTCTLNISNVKLTTE